MMKSKVPNTPIIPPKVKPMYAQSKDIQKCIVRKEKYMLEKYILKTEKSCITNG